MNQESRAAIVKGLTELIVNGNAHVSLTDAIADLPKNLRTEIPANLPYSIWQLIEHMRIAQKDIVDFSESGEFEKLNWPDDYWTPNVAEVEDDVWEQSLNDIEADQNRFFHILNDTNRDLFKPFEWGEGQTLFREATLIADHNAYHTAEIVVIRRLLGAWK